jgi:proline iminopeptidase
MRTLYPPLEANRTFRLRVSELHELYVEEAGNPDGIPVVFLHGGPGGGIHENHRRLFDPALYRIVLFDQRGAGRSTPHACLEQNTTWDLVADIEALRIHLGIDRWLVFGGSWGSTLALAYAETHPERVSGLILRGIFLCTEAELRWFYQEGCHWLYPDRWESYLAPIPPEERQDLITAYYHRLISPDEQIRLTAAKAWSGWEGATCHLIPDEATVDDFEEDLKALAMARIECHYFVNRAFFNETNHLLHPERIARIRHLPTWIIHGRYDVICPVKNAWDLHQAFPQATLRIIPDAGHAYNEPGILTALIEATEDFARQHPYREEECRSHDR